MKKEELTIDQPTAQDSSRIIYLQWEVLLVVGAALILTWIGLAWNMGICLGLGAACALSIFSLDFLRNENTEK